MKYTVRTLETLISVGCNMGCKYCFEGKNNSQNKFVKFEEIKKYIDENYNLDFYVFGGEPLLNIDTIIQTVEYLKDLDINKERKAKLMDTFGRITTNGTLIKKYFDKIKMLNSVENFRFRFQISLDGPQHINDINRYYKNKSSTYDDIMEGIQLLEENNIPYDIHGVLPPEALLNYLDIVKWRIDLFKKFNKSNDEIVSRFQGNWAMAIFEHDYTDEFIDKFLVELDRTAQWIMYNDDFTKKQKRDLYDAIIVRRKVYGICSAGRGLKTLDTVGNIYSCHRSVDELTTYNFKDEACLGNINDISTFKNFKLFNRFDFVANNGLAYSTNFMIDVFNKYKTGNNNFNDICWAMWCPTSSIETSNNEAYINAKYIVFVKEVDNFINNYLEQKYWNKNGEKTNIFI